MDQLSKKFVCINCGSKVDEIFKRYSATVLKLKNCIFCHNIVDKYVEYDPVIILIDLVLFKKEAYRHIIFNTSFANHWKLAILIQLMEAYSEWTLSSGEKPSTKQMVNFEQFEFKDTDFFKLCIKVTFKALCFVVTILLLTMIYKKLMRQDTKEKFNMLNVWKCIILSSFGIFLFLPSLIWDEHPIEEFHMLFVSLYTTLSQLIAYTVVCNCAKLWSIIVILISYYCKELSVHIFEEFYNQFVYSN